MLRNTTNGTVLRRRTATGSLRHVGHAQGGNGEPFAPPCADHGLQFRVPLHRNSESVSHGGHRAVIVGRSDAAGGDDRIESLRARAHLGGDDLDVVSDVDQALEADPQLPTEIDKHGPSASRTFPVRISSPMISPATVVIDAGYRIPPPSRCELRIANGRRVFSGGWSVGGVIVVGCGS